MSTKRKYFGTDGVRGRVGQAPITADFILQLGWAVGSVIRRESGAGKVVIGKDTRISGYMFEAALEAGFSAAGVDVYLLGPMPTPAIAYLTRTFHADAGVVISASHNPYYDNGIKFFSAQGVKLPDHIELMIEAELEKPMQTVESLELGKAWRIDDAPGRYIEYCKATIPNDLTLSGLKIVVDCAHGATYHVAPSVFRELGAEVVTIGVEPNGTNINDNVGATSPQALCKKVLSEGADIGIALDGDGDRLIVIDHAGSVVDGDDLLYIMAKDYQQQGVLQGGVVGTVMSNLGLEKALDRENIAFVRAQVGDRYVVEEMHARAWNLGGESSGHLICSDVTTTGDGIVAALQVLASMKRLGKNIQELKAGFKKYPQKMINVPVKKRLGHQAWEKVNQEVVKAEAQLGERGRVLLRPSGTEPLVRVMVEGENMGEITRCAEDLADVVREYS
ncbi:phosphoglucosamine mutase [Piscirickettsia salmonis]|uniref:Phosphoglucosamine mutase n=1 Tax=Piscirickettsia salmonis TaxID=1238 RepID=A0A9Q6PUT1_PISSA|nr:phosphoglucosamine mutase [Piscirickettsia salmonis]RNC78939.1 phosphoglucosamine mutase [Piscirickettsiaceae bacterium NZ-RLO2]ALA26325.1 phosphoglucosamine mutase [Piscirickettsia salmonis]APS43757.1 phosphoglucosamine mutase [Piscirickettsia salmonis]APS47112.1 phosphoglucosamine mutase [Piscirickettsia salmonis]APS51446.1 phosphoglucosamine mutase [Piscirickettsia salmonis]